MTDSNIRDTNIEKLKKKFGDIEVVSKNEASIKENGKKIFLNSKGEQSGRLLSFQLNGVYRNGKFLSQNMGNCFLNVNRKTSKRLGKIIAETKLSMSLRDMKNNVTYYISLPIGRLLVLILLRDKIPDVDNHFTLLQRTVNNELNELMMTPYFKALLGGDENIQELLVKKKPGKKRGRKPKIKTDNNKSMFKGGADYGV